MKSPTTESPTDTTEARRLDRLRMLGILDTPPESSFDNIVRLAARICGAEISLVSLIDHDRQWFKANFGLSDVAQTDRDVAFCDHAIRGAELLEVQDARQDSRFSANPLVLGEPNIRFYAGVPIVMPGGERVGTLCVIDRHPRALAAEQRESLRDLSMVVRDLLVQREKLTSIAATNSHAYDSALVDLMPAGVLQADTGGALVRVNPVWKELFGVDDEQASRGAWLSKVHPDDRDGVVAAWAHAVGGQIACEREFRLLGDSKTTWVRCVLRPIAGPQGDCRGFVGVTSDVTNLLAMEQALAESNRLLQHAESISGVGSWTFDVESGELRWTDHLKRIFQLPAAHVPILETLFSHFDTEDRQKLRKAYRKAVDEGQGWSLPLRATTAKGRPIWLRSVGVPEQSDDGGLRLVGTFQDITAQLEREHALLRANSLLQTILDNLPCGLSVFDGDHRLLTCNAMFRSMLDLPDELFHAHTTFRQLARYRAERGDYGPGEPQVLIFEQI